MCSPIINCFVNNMIPRELSDRVWPAILGNPFLVPGVFISPGGWLSLIGCYQTNKRLIQTDATLVQKTTWHKALTKKRDKILYVYYSAEGNVQRKANEIQRKVLNWDFNCLSRQCIMCYILLRQVCNIIYFKHVGLLIQEELMDYNNIKWNYSGKYSKLNLGTTLSIWCFYR